MTKKEFLDRLAENNWNRPGDQAFFRKFYDYMKDFGDREDPLSVDTMWAPYTLFDLEGDRPSARESVEGFIRRMINDPVYDVPEDLKESFQNNLIDGNPGIEEPEEEDEIDGPENENEIDGPEDEYEYGEPEEGEVGQAEGGDAPEENAGGALEEEAAPQMDEVDRYIRILTSDNELLQYVDERIKAERENEAERRRAAERERAREEAAENAEFAGDQEAQVGAHIRRKNDLDLANDLANREDERRRKSDFTKNMSLREFVTKARQNGWTSMDDLSVFVGLYNHTYRSIFQKPGFQTLM